VSASADTAARAPSRHTQSTSFFWRQLILAVVAGAVVLVALVVVAVAVDNGREAADAALRPAADGTVRPGSVSDSFRVAIWAVVVALVAVAALLTVLLGHMIRVARFAVLARPGPRDEAAGVAAQEDDSSWP
jgi:type VI protein secretion system component VasF